jgi:hypothetical protein
MPLLVEEDPAADRTDQREEDQQKEYADEAPHRPLRAGR